MSRFACSILALAIATTGYGQAQMSPEMMLEGGIRTEIVDGNLTEAIAIYEDVASRPDVDRAVAARALLHLAGCYEKLGDDEALAVYRRLRDDYADVAEVAARARERLAALGEAGALAQDRTRWREPEFVNEISGGSLRGSMLLRSPDGRYGAFTDYFGTPREEPGAQGGGVDGYNVVVVDYETETLTRLTAFATVEQGISDIPLWAPDSERLAYAAKGPGRDHEVRVFTVGGTSRVVYRRTPMGSAYFAAEPTSWSPDGRSLALLLDNGDDSVTVGILDVASGEVAQLATFAWPRRPAGGPHFSPDGRYLAFARTVAGNNEIFTLAVDGSRMAQLTDDPATDAWPLWSRDGSHVLFVSDRLGENGLWAIPLEDGRATAAPTLLDRSFPAYRAPRWVGDRLAYTERLYPRDVYTVPVDPASGEATGPARKVDYTPAGPQVGVAWSGDGALAFFSRTTPDKVVVLKPDGATEDFRLPEEFQAQGILGALQFDTTGRVVSFTSQGRLVSVDTDSGEWSVSKLPEQIGPLVWKGPEPGTLYYATHATSPPLVRRLDLGSGEETDVFELDQEAALHTMWLSPDGRRLRIADGRTLSELELASGLAQELFRVDRSLPAGSCTGQWGDIAPDGGKVAIAGIEELFVVDLESGETRGLGVRLDRLFAGLPVGKLGCFRFVRWSPRGDRIAFMAQNPTLQSWTIADPLEKALGGTARR